MFSPVPPDAANPTNFFPYTVTILGILFETTERPISSTLITRLRGFCIFWN
jgi:hypothetical protein